MGLLAVGCSSASKKALKRAERADEEGRLYDAAAYYDEACRRKPGEACDLADEVLDEAVSGDVADARALLKDGRTREAYELMAEARDFDPEHPDVIAFDRDWKMSVVAACENVIVQAKKDPREYLRAIQCVEQFPSRQDGKYQMKAEQKRLANKVSAAMITSSADPSLAPGLRYEVAVLGQCKGPTRDTGKALTITTQLSAKSNAAYMSASKVKLNGKKVDSRAVCQTVSEESKGALRCDAKDRSKPWSIEATFKADEFRHIVESEDKTVTYLNGTETKDNPEYQRNREEYLLAERAFLDAEIRHNKEESDCIRYRGRGNCAQITPTNSTYYRRKRELASAKAKLDGTATTVERDVKKSRSYTQRHHRWEAPVEYVAKLSIGGRMIKKWENTTVANVEDSENPGIPEAKISADPLVEPTPKELDQGVLREGIRQMLPTFRDEMKSLADKKAKACQKKAGRSGSGVEGCKADHLARIGQRSEIRHAELLGSFWGQGIRCAESGRTVVER